MKKTLIIILALISFNLVAQRSGSGEMDAERIKAARVAFLTEKLNLDVETAQAFWPVFNEFESAREELNEKFMVRMKEDIGIDNPRRAMENLSEEQAAALLALMFERKSQELDLEKNYMNRFAKVITSKQVLIVSQFEAEFRRTLMRRYSEESRARRNKSGNGN